jgi:23S rRNA (adenine2503-C2)-methyltransferase
MMEVTRTPLVGMDAAALAAFVESLGHEAFRARQIARHLYRRAVRSFDEMSDLSTALRLRLGEAARVSPLEAVSHRRSAGGAEKLLVHSGDEQVFECVLLPYAGRVSCCISTQVGCPMGCAFCATGLGGFDRNLTPGEIVGQYLLLQGISPRRIGHVAFMGMGEPLLNLPNVLAALRLFKDQIGLSHRNITISTVGIVPQILQLAGHRLQIHLALSLHSPLDEVRSRLMPVNNKWPVAEVMAAMNAYQRATGRKITIEYLLIEGVNDSREEAVALAGLVKGAPHVVNLIPFNCVATEQGFQRPKPSRVRAFRAELERRGVNVTERLERGHDIAAACGQLAGSHTGRFARRNALRVAAR